MQQPHAPLFHYRSRRLHLLLLVMFGLFNSQYMNTNLAITMTCMVNYTAVALEHEQLELERDSRSVSLGTTPSNASDLIDEPPPSQCGAATRENGTGGVLDYGGSLVWDGSEQNWLFSASFWGAVITIIPSIIFVQRLSPKWVFAVAIGNKVLINALIPFLAVHYGFHAVFVARLILGFGEPFIYPSVNTIVSNWFPLEERSTAVAIFTTGNQLAMFIGNPLASSLCSSTWGWPAVFYSSAILGSLWIVMWCMFSSNCPAECRAITNLEKNFLQHTSTVPDLENKKAPAVPWCAILTNPAFLSHLFCTYCISVVITFMLTYLPTYFKDVLLLSVMANGLFTSLPMVFNFCFKLTWGMIVDKLKQAKLLTLTQAVRLSQCFPTFGVALPLFLVIPFVSCSTPVLALTLLCISNMFLGAHTSGAYTSLLSLAPVYTPTLSSISVSLSMVAQLTTPLLVGQLKSTGTVAEWNNILLSVAVLSTLSGVQFLIYGSGEVQKFAYSKTDKERPEDEILLKDMRVQSLRAASISQL